MCRKMKKASARTSRAKAYFHGTTLICAQQCRTHLSDPVSGIGRSACRRLLGSGCFPCRTRTCSECPLSRERRDGKLVSSSHFLYCVSIMPLFRAVVNRNRGIYRFHGDGMCRSEGKGAPRSSRPTDMFHFPLSIFNSLFARRQIKICKPMTKKGPAFQRVPKERDRKFSF